MRSEVCSGIYTSYRDDDSNTKMAILRDYSTPLVFVALICFSMIFMVDAQVTCVNCPDYLALTAQQKQDMIYSRAATGALTSNFNNQYANGATQVFLESMDTTFDRFADEFPSGRVRAIHGRSALAKIKYTVVSNTLGLTGIYNTGAPNGVIRLSLAGDPTNSFSPGFGIKFFVNGQVSANLVGMFSLDGQGANYNFFANQLKTRIAKPTTTNFLTGIAADVGIARFETGAKPATQLDPDQPSYYNADGTPSAVTPKWPQALYLVPNPALNQSFSTAAHEFRSDLLTIPSNTLLYTVYATLDAASCSKCGVGNAEPCPDIFAVGGSCQVQEIGQITSTSTFVASPYVDNGVFFQHSRVIKETRRTCVYAKSRDDTNKDSTVLPTVANSMADCQQASLCPIWASKGSSGCITDNFVPGAGIVSPALDNNPGYNPSADPLGSASAQIVRAAHAVYVVVIAVMARLIL